MQNWVKFNINQNTYNPVTVKDIVSDKPEIVHKILFETALAMAVVNDLNKEDSYFVVEEYNGEDIYDSIVKCYIKNDKYVYVENFADNDDKRYIVNLNRYKIYEDTSDAKTFYDPTYAIIISKRLDNKNKLNFRKLKIDLSKFWENEYNKEFLSKIKPLNEKNDEYPFNEIVYYDYIQGKAKLENKVEGKIKWVRFDEISEDDNLDVELYF